jgi:hypothetical protein
MNKTIAAKAGRCSACGCGYTKGSWLAQAEGMDSAGHWACATALRERARLLAGDTYRSGASSGYRIRKSRSSGVWG